MAKWIALCLFIIAIGCKTSKHLSEPIPPLGSTEDFNNFKFQYSEDQDIYTLRVNIHVIQDSLGRGNFTIIDSLGENAPGWYWLREVVRDAGARMGKLDSMNMPSSSAHISESYIRYEVVGVYAWPNQKLYELHSVIPSTGHRMYEYVMEQDDVDHKEDALQLFIAGRNNKDGGKIASRGIASGAPDKRWTVLFNMHQLSKQKRSYWPATLIMHEIGHNLGLRHTWNQNDGCDDTPMNPYHLNRSATGFQCWALNEPATSKCDSLHKCSNNMMDYNAYQNALTECQLAKIHYNIKENKGNLQDVLYVKE